MNKGTVIKSTGSWYNVRPDDDPNKVVVCRIVGKFRLNNMVLTNPVAVGDEVEFKLEGDGNGVIQKILPRRNYIARQSSHRKHEVHLLAANVDQTILFATIVEPMLKLGFIDRFLLMNEPQDVPVVLVFNKCDLYDDEDWEVFENVKDMYGNIGYTVLATSATEGVGISELQAILKDKTSLIGGQSGVGKSSAVNAVQPHLALLTGDISDYSGKGQHTTTFAEMHTLDFGGFLIDTPGIKTLAFNNLQPMDVIHNFKEFFALSENCRFGGSCTHRNEPACAVKQALAEGTVSDSRYDNYVQILEEVESQKYWQRDKEV
ncbi:MAG: ribosome small subunit-dependent GTPase A [Saprospiraceae bacterium]|nr:ribosome small subunit-dependent GTPase A [Saprospiraceae bacterium]